MKLSEISRRLSSDTYLRTQIVLGFDLIVSLASSIGVFLLLSLLLPSFTINSHELLAWVGFSLIASILSFTFFKVYRAIIRYTTLREISRICASAFGKDVLLWLAVLCVKPSMAFTATLIGMVLVDFLLTLFALLFLRVAMIVSYDIIRAKDKRDRNVRHVLVYGVGDKSASAVGRLRNSTHYNIDGFITFGPEMRGHQLAGHPVYYFENLKNLKGLTGKYSFDGILFPNVNDARIEQDRLIKYCRTCQLKTYVIPAIDEMTDDNALGNYIRKIKIEDLLGRPEIKISMDEIIANFSDKVIMVTGAAGSIGSELCRQLARFGIKRLILFDNAETPLHNIRLELEDTYPDLDFIPVIGDVRSERRLDFVFRKHRPQIVFHAAAYKHVPLMEENPCEAVRVNVTGSRQVADKCVEYDVEKMVMVSTDKAVNPTNIMGCTKRLAEIYVQSLGLAIERGQIKGRTKFVTTRFGNVLGSNGSVIPRFREQIEHGGPITVTHPNITRFFMTIPEACRLVMEAATFSTGTQIFVFDMGESVKIVTLAERMIHLAGLEVGRDIKIEFTGLRPGEKLYEEVLATKENTIPTTHSRIFVAMAREYAYGDAKETMLNLDDLARQVEIPPMVILMKKTVPEFKSKNSIYEQYDVYEEVKA